MLFVYMWLFSLQHHPFKLKTNEDLDQDEILEESDDEPVEDMEFETVQGELGSLQAKWSDDENWVCNKKTLTNRQ